MLRGAGLVAELQQAGPKLFGLVTRSELNEGMRNA